MAPSRTGSVVIDIGGDVGALVVYTEGALAGTELEITPCDPAVACTHTSVRERRTDRASVFAAVFPALAAGDYIVPPMGAEPATTVAIHPGRVTELHLHHKEAASA